MVKKTFFFLIFLCSFYSNGNAQNYTEEHYQFDVNYKTMLGYYNRGDYAKAAEFPDSLFNNKYTDKHTFYMIARVYALNIDYFKTLENLEKATKLGITKSQIESMYDLDAFRKSSMNLVFELNYEKWHEEFIEKENTKPIDSIYLKKVNSLKEVYKEARAARTYIVKGDSSWFAKDSSARYTSRIITDSVYYETLDYILKEGFPTYQRIGSDFYAFSSFLKNDSPDSLSLSDEKWLQVKSLIEKEMKRGKIKPFYYAALEDSYRMSHKEPQLYGTINYVYNYNMINYLEYEKPEEINIRRRSVGLCPIDLKLWSTAQDLPPALENIKFK